jgi:Ran GTPase-activating protein (RanGAP) involved in mRNA processing and transport
MSAVVKLVCAIGDEITEKSDVQVSSILELYAPMRFSALTSLKITDAALTPDDVTVLAPLLPTSLQVLDISHLSLTPRCISILSKRLPRMRLFKLDISDNPIGDESVWLLLEFIKKDENLTSLNLANCNIGSAGVWPICVAVSQRPFDCLNLSQNAIGVHGAEYIRKMLANFPPLKELHINNAALSQGDVEVIIAAARGCEKTQLLSLLGNESIAWQDLPPFVRAEVDRPMR